MAKKAVKYLVAIIVVVFLAWNSVYFKKLNEVKASAVKQFNATAYARSYVDKQLLPSVGKAPEIDQLLIQLKSKPDSAFKLYSHALDIGNIRFFMTSGQGTVTSVDENEVCLLTPNKQTIKIATEYIFGNALRDAPGIININDFTNTMDLNNVSAEVNKIVRNEIVPSFKSKVKKGSTVTFAGAFELNQEHINLNKIEIIPVSLKTAN
jgi:predicted lipoprotein